MILHVLFVDDEEDVLESLVPGFIHDLARRLAGDADVRKASEQAGFPLPPSGRINIKVSATGYRSAKVPHYAFHRPVHIHVHLCCEKGGGFRHALRLLKEDFFAVAVSDLRFSDDVVGSRAGRFLIEDIHRRNPETFAILYSAYGIPEGFPADRFIRKGSARNLGGEELLDAMVRGFAHYLRQPLIQRLAREAARRGLVYQSDAFGATLRRLVDYAGMYFGQEIPNPDGRRRPRPTLLIDGETGTGKTELAGLLHAISDRRDAPFVTATCSQLTDENFLRSVLFGHIKGSFSGASADRPGLVQAAGKGLLLLDDLHKLNESCSVILHSFLDDGAYSHLGQDEVRRQSESAIVATVESPRWDTIKQDQLLPESFIHRVEQLVLRVPPLRQRPEDIDDQARHYCQTCSREIGEEMELSRGAIDWLIDHGFPGGNSRKLRDFIRGVVTAHARVTDYLDVEELDEFARERGQGAAKGNASRAGESATAPTSSGSPWPPTDGGSAWTRRIADLAAKAIADECGLGPVDARAACQALFESHFPKLWDEWTALTRRIDPAKPMDIKLFDELLRYFAIFRAGSPVRAAKELGMKDNALREFVYSRELKRDIADPSSDNTAGRPA